MTALEGNLGNCHLSKTNVNLGFTSVDIVFLGVTFSHVNLSCSQYLYNIYVCVCYVEKFSQYRKLKKCLQLNTVFGLEHTTIYCINGLQYESIHGLSQCTLEVNTQLFLLRNEDLGTDLSQITEFSRTPRDVKVVIA